MVGVARLAFALRTEGNRSGGLRSPGAPSASFTALALSVTVRMLAAGSRARDLGVLLDRPRSSRGRAVGPPPCRQGTAIASLWMSSVLAIAAAVWDGRCDDVTDSCTRETDRPYCVPYSVLFSEGPLPIELSTSSVKMHGTGSPHLENVPYANATPRRHHRDSHAPTCAHPPSHQLTIKSSALLPY
jgi:hypothetical protein